MPLNTLQQQAVDLAVNSRHKVVVISGGPGVGKTFTMKTIMDELRRKFGASDASIQIGAVHAMLAAPTGRAAKRLNESTGYGASTIHRLLEPQKDAKGGGFFFTRNEGNPIPSAFLGLDESSMIDVPLMASVCKALRPDARLILVGDADQLPSVGPGKVLADCISAGVPNVRLTEILRQAEGSNIIKNAHRINSGSLPRDSRQDREAPKDDFVWYKDTDEDDIVDRVRKLALRITEETGVRPQVIVPMHRPKVGTKNLNKQLQQVLNPGGSSRNKMTYGKDDWAVVYQEGDVVMNLKNDYDRGLMNGDVGRIVRIETKRGAEPKDDKIVVYVDFNVVVEDVSKETGEGTGHYRDESKISEFSRDSLMQLVHAWAITIHKSQGCEWDDVIIPLWSGHSIMLQRNLLYTAATRAKKRVFLIGSEAAVQQAVRTTNAMDRQTLLGRMLRDEV